MNAVASASRSPVSGSAMGPSITTWWRPSPSGTDSAKRTAAPVRIASSAGVAEVAAGHQHVIVRMTNGELWSFGDISQGQLGLNAGSITATPRHVPAKILQVADIPRTKSGKIVELAVRDVVHGREVRNREALANPESLAEFRDRPELKS